MIQRIQTLFLLLGVIASGFISLNCVGLWEHLAFAIVAILTFISIFLFKKRKIQLIISSYLVLPFYLCGLFLLYFFGENHYEENTKRATLGIAFIVGILSTLMAISKIRKDEKLVQESNRLR